MTFRFEPFKDLPEVLLIEPQVFGDERGWFKQTYQESAFRTHVPEPFRQDNYSYSRQRGTLRGLHFQRDPAAQAKLVQCPQGEFFEVVVDIRKGSPTYGRSVSTTLSAANHRVLYVPWGFAHGVQTLVDDTLVAYKVTNEYSPKDDRSIRWDDPDLKIRWPLKPVALSKKDAEAPFLRDSDNEFVYSTKRRQA